MKTYVKPDLAYESFELSQNIAVCGWDMSNQSAKEDCSAYGDESLGNFPVNLFTAGNELCDMTEDQVEGYCYEVSTGAMAVFNS